MSSVTLYGITFDEADFAGYGYLDTVTVDGIGYRRFQALFICALKDAGRALVTTSASSLEIGTGSKTFVLAVAVPFAVGAFVLASDPSNPTNFMIGQVTAKAGNSITLNVTTTSGSGTKSAWNIMVTGSPGDVSNLAGRVSAVEAAQAAGLVGYATKALLDANTGAATGTLGYVYANNGSLSDPANGIYQKTATVWAFATWYYTAAQAAVQPLVEQAEAAAAEVAESIVTMPVAPELVPLAIDAAGNVVLYLQNGKLGALDLTDDLKAILSLSSTNAFEPRRSPRTSARPIVTDGRSISQWRAALAKLKQSGSGKAKVLLTGDSWTEFVAIPQGLASLLHAAHGKAGEGWISAHLTYLMSGMTSALSGWTLQDANVLTPVRRTGLDGNSIYATGTAAVASLSGCVCTAITIFYEQANGTFRYRVDGGSWTSVTGDGSGNLGVRAITGLANAAHTLEIDLTGNGGTVNILGFYATVTGATGVEVLKCGNAGLSGPNIAGFDEYIADIATVLAPDVIVVFLGTNDYRISGRTPASLTTGLGLLVTAYRSVLPNIGFIIVAPADSNGMVAATTPLSGFRDAVYQWCLDQGHDFYNMNEDWASYAVENARGMWVDNLHLNNAGGYRVAARLKSQFLDL